MNIFIIERYIQKIKKEDIYKFATTKNITLTTNELDTIYNYLKTYYKTFLRDYNSHTKILIELKSKLSLPVANKIDELYNQYKDKI